MKRKQIVSSSDDEINQLRTQLKNISTQNIKFQEEINKMKEISNQNESCIVTFTI